MQCGKELKYQGIHTMVGMDDTPEGSANTKVKGGDRRQHKMVMVTALPFTSRDHPLCLVPPASELLKEWCPGSSRLKQRATEAHTGGDTHPCPFGW